jgi:hypothetical protein
MSIGGLTILSFFPSFIGSISNLFDYGVGGDTLESTIYRGLCSISGVTAFGVGWRLNRNEIGVVFISLGCLTFMVCLISMLGEFMKFSPFNTSYSVDTPKIKTVSLDN